jgi:hypothetical protein
MHRAAVAVAACHEAPGPGWHDDELGGRMDATAAESREQVTDLNRRMRAHSDATIGELLLAGWSIVLCWPEERRHPTLHTLLVHTLQQTARHPATRTSSGRWDGARSSDLNAEAPLQPRL